MAHEKVYLDAIIDKYMVYFTKQGVQNGKQLVDSIVKHVNVATNTFVCNDQVVQRIATVSQYQKQLDSLQNLPKMQQRSDQWYKARNGMITASDFAQALGRGKFGTQKQFYEKKCGYEQDTFNANNPALKWGVMFEPVATSIYELKTGMIVHEFGLLQHPGVPWVGASPDGISELGVMLEIKCPWKRKINGEIPEQYYYQMQGQLDVCDLDECDYLECEFGQYHGYDDFVARFNETTNPKGVIVAEENNGYVYSPTILCNDLEGLQEWVAPHLANERNALVFYYLNKYSVIRVYRDKQFIQSTYKELEHVWNNVVAFKADKGKYDAHMKPPTSGAPGAPHKLPKEHVSIDTSFKQAYVKKSGEVKFTGYAFLET